MEEKTYSSSVSNQKPGSLESYNVLNVHPLVLVQDILTFITKYYYIRLCMFLLDIWISGKNQQRQQNKSSHNCKEVKRRKQNPYIQYISGFYNITYVYDRINKMSNVSIHSLIVWWIFRLSKSNSVSPICTYGNFIMFFFFCSVGQKAINRISREKSTKHVKQIEDQ